MRRIEATLVYLFKGEEVLMLERVKKKGDIHLNKWNGLGGKVELHESVVDCAFRELKEESGLDAGRMEFAGHICFPRFDKQGNDWSVTIFRAYDAKGDLGECDEGNLKWIHQDEIIELNLWEGDRHFIPLVLAKEAFFGVFSYKKGQLSSHKLEIASDIRANKFEH